MESTIKNRSRRVYDMDSTKATLMSFIARVLKNGLELDLEALWNKIRHLFNFSPDVDYLVLMYLVKQILNPLGISVSLRNDTLPCENASVTRHGVTIPKIKSMMNQGGKESILLRKSSRVPALMNAPSLGKEKSGILYLDNIPDDLIIEISSRLSFQDARRFRFVCKQFWGLLGRPDFVNSHVRRCAPMILVVGPAMSRLYFMDISWNISGTTARYLFVRSDSLFHLDPHYDPQLSLDGLIVSKKNPGNHSEFIVFNPIYREKVELVVPDGCQILGVYYQPLVKEYRTIWEHTVSSEPLRVAYKVLNLSCQENWREIMNPFTHNARIWAIAPVLLNVHLYWAVNSEPEGDKRVDIIEFDTINERFEVIPCPDNVKLRWGVMQQCNLSLQKANGCLVLMELSTKHVQAEIRIKIWKLENRMKKIWSRGIEYLFNGSDCPDNPNRVEVIAFWNEEMLIQNRDREYLINLKLRKIASFGPILGGGDFTSHVMSLASLKGCNPKICVDEVKRDQSCDKAKKLIRV